MSDIKLFRIGAGTVDELAGTTDTIEKSVQTFFEKNLEALLGVRFLASEFNTSNGGRVDTLGLQNGGFVVAWQSSDGAGADIFVRRLMSPTGTVGVFRANTTTAAAQTQPALAAFDNGAFLVTWTSQGQDGAGLGIFGQMFDATGAPENSEIGLNTSIAHHQVRSSVAALADGNFVATWTTRKLDNSLKGAFGQRFRFDGF